MFTERAPPFRCLSNKSGVDFRGNLPGASRAHWEPRPSWARGRVTRPRHCYVSTLREPFVVTRACGPMMKVGMACGPQARVTYEWFMAPMRVRSADMVAFHEPFDFAQGSWRSLLVRCADVGAFHESAIPLGYHFA